MTKEKGKPQIRFSGFKDTWEQRKFSDLADYKKGPFGSAITKDMFVPQSEDSIKVYEQQNAINKDWSLARYFLPKDYALTKLKSFEVHGGDIIVSCAGTIGEIYEIPENADSGVINQALMRVRINEDVIDKKMFIIEFSNMIDAFTRTHSNGSAIKNIPPFADLKPTEVLMPSMEEQKKISKYFANLDNLITLYQCKVDKLTAVKKSMLEKMFPKNGRDVPEIRFKGFTEAWEQRKVTELGEIYIGLVTTMTSHYTDQGALLIRNSDIKDGCFEFGDDPIYLDDDFAKQNASRKHRVGDVITVHTGDIGTSAVISEKEAGSIGFATIVTRPNKDIITSDYLCIYLNTDTHKNFAMNISTGDGRNNYNLKDYYECVVPVPSLDEQNKISDFIKNINHLITLHQRKLEKLKNIKKSMLEKMFV